MSLWANRATSRVIRLYYGYQFFFPLLFWIPVFYEYQKIMGLDDGRIFAIQSLYYLVFCFLEIPTGYFADRLGYRLSLRMSGAVLVLSNVLAIYWTSYTGFVAHWLFLALARSFYSGASSAWLFEYLSQNGAVGRYKEVEGRSRALNLVGRVVGWMGIGALMQWHVTLPYWMTVGAAVGATVFAFLLPDVKPLLERVRAASLWKDLTPVGTMLASSPQLFLLMFQSLTIFVLARICQVNLFQPILKEKEFGVASFGVIMAVSTVFEAVGSFRPGMVRRWMSDLNAVFVFSAVIALSLGALAWMGQWGTVALLCVFSFAGGVAIPIQRQVLNEAIPDPRYRATLLSVESIINRAVCAWVASLIGAFVARGETLYFLQLSAGASLVFLLALYFVMTRLQFGVSPSRLLANCRKVSNTD